MVETVFNQQAALDILGELEKDIDGIYSGFEKDVKRINFSINPSESPEEPASPAENPVAPAEEPGVSSVSTDVPVYPKSSGNEPITTSRFGLDDRGNPANWGSKLGFSSSSAGSRSVSPTRNIPKWRGLRGIGRWLWKGYSPDNPDYSHLYRREHLTLEEYCELSKEIDGLISEVLIVESASMYSDELLQRCQQFKKDVIAAIRGTREKIRLFGAPEDVSAEKIAQDTAERDAVISPVSSPEIAPVAQSPDDSQTSGSKVAVLRTRANEIASLGRAVLEPQEDWFLTTTEGGVKKGRLSKNVKKLHHIDVLAWLIRKGANILDDNDVKQKLKEVVKKDVSGNVADQTFEALDEKPNDQQSVERFNLLLKKLGWKGEEWKPPISSGPVTRRPRGRPRKDQPADQNDVLAAPEVLAEPEDLDSDTSEPKFRRKSAKAPEPQKAPEEPAQEPELPDVPDVPVSRPNKSKQKSLFGQENEPAVATAEPVESDDISSDLPDAVKDASVVKVKTLADLINGITDERKKKEVLKHWDNAKKSIAGNPRLADQLEIIDSIINLAKEIQDECFNPLGDLLRVNHDIRVLKAKQIPIMELKNFYLKLLKN